MILKVDIDNVIRDMGSQMVSVYNRKFGTSLSKNDIKDYDVDKSFPLLEGNAKEFFFSTNQEQLYKWAFPMNDAIEGLKLARKLGHTIILMSFQPGYRQKTDTLEWLSLHAVPYDAIIFTNTESKKFIAADYIIDDNPKFLDEDSARTVCIDWAYNRDREYDFRVRSISEFIYEHLY